MSYLSAEEIRKLFPWFECNKEMIYLDNSATTLKPKSVIDAYSEYFTRFGTNPHNTSSAFTFRLKEQLALSRQKIASLVGCREDNIVFTSGATESLNLFAFGLRNILKPVDNIVIPEFEHSSNILPWYELAELTGVTVRVVRFKDFVTDTKVLLKSIDRNTKIVSFSNCNNLVGFQCDAGLIATQIKRKFPNIVVCVDATQYIQHNKLNLSNGDGSIDLCAFSMHKLYGPNGVGIAYINDRLFRILQPHKLGGGCYKHYSNVPSEGYTLLDNYSRFEAGTPNVSGIFAIPATVDFLQSVNNDQIMQHERELANKLVAGLSQIKDLHVVNINRSAPIVSFYHENVHSHDIADYLGRQKIIVRSGHGCAPLLCDFVGRTDGFVRASFGCYNTEEEVEYFLTKMRTFTKGDLVDNVN